MGREQSQECRPSPSPEDKSTIYRCLFNKKTTLTRQQEAAKNNRKRDQLMDRRLRRRISDPNKRFRKEEEGILEMKGGYYQERKNDKG